jgi:transcriptional antiterminator RfaH
VVSFTRAFASAGVSAALVSGLGTILRQIVRVAISLFAWLCPVATCRACQNLVRQGAAEDPMSYDDQTTNEWFAVQVWAGRERISAQHLRVRGFAVFLPCYRDHRRWSDRVKVVERALFEGYVFCRFASDVVGKILTAPGVIRIVGDATGPLSIPRQEIEAIERIVASQLATEPWPTPRVGQRTRIEYGPLRGIEGVVVAVKNQSRLLVEISLLRRAVAVEIDAAWVNASHPLFAG